jgi:Rrf2 family protein
MLSLNRKTDYALIALAYMADRAGQWSSAREIAEVSEVPSALLMNILKTLHQGHILRSSRGSRGGYRIATDLERLSLFDLIRVLENEDVDEPQTDGDGEPACCGRYNISRAGLHGPVHAFHHKLRRFLKTVKLSDLVLPGRRIDVPVEMVGNSNRNGTTARAGKTNPTPRGVPTAMALT